MKKIGIIVGGVVAVAVVGVGLSVALNQDHSIGIIGGADGPTSIIVSEKASLDQKVSAALLGDSDAKYLDGEVKAEGHIILGSEVEGNETVVYALTMYGEYGFEDNHLVKVSGTGVIPAVIKLVENDQGKISSGIEWPRDGADYTDSIKEMFPKKYHDRILSIKEEDRDSLKVMEREYAQNYLKQIGREAEIGEYADFEHTLLTELGVSVKVSNKLLEKNFGNYPMWVGNQEKVEDGVRYVYQMDYERGGEKIVLSKYRYETKEVVEKIEIDAMTGEVLGNNV